MRDLLGYLKRTRWRAPRYVLVSAVTIWWIAGSAMDAFQHCSYTTRDTAVTEVCRPPQLSDASVLAVLLVVLLLLWPDLSQFDAFGVSVRRRVEKAEKAASDARERVIEVQSLLVSQLSNTATATNHVQFFGTPGGITREDLEAAFVRAQESQHEEADGDPKHPIGTESPDAPTPRQEDQEAALLSSEIIRNWELVRHRIDWPASVRPTTETGRTAREWTLLAEQRGFAEAYALEIEVVRAVRNSVAHGIPVPLEDLRRAHEVSASLLRASDNLGRDNERSFRHH